MFKFTQIQNEISGRISMKIEMHLPLNGEKNVEHSNERYLYA